MVKCKMFKQIRVYMCSVVVIYGFVVWIITWQDLLTAQHVNSRLLHAQAERKVGKEQKAILPCVVADVRKHVLCWKYFLKIVTATGEYLKFTPKSNINSLWKTSYVCFVCLLNANAYYLIYSRARKF